MQIYFYHNNVVTLEGINMGTTYCYITMSEFHSFFMETHEEEYYMKKYTFQKDDTQQFTKKSALV